MRNRRKGQGVLELVVVIGIIALVLGGVVTLLVQVMGARGKSFDRKKATRLADVVMESLVEEEKNDPGAFWPPSDIDEQSWGGGGFDGYVYSVEFTDESCDRVCSRAVLTVGWSGSSDQSVIFSRFFSK